MIILRKKTYSDNNSDSEKKNGLSTAAKVGLGVAGTTAAVGGGLVAARKGLLGHKLQGKVGRAYEKLGEKLGIKSLVEKGEEAQWKSAVTELEKEAQKKTIELGKKVKNAEPFDPEVDKGIDELVKLNETRDQVAKNIQERHQGAAKSIKESIDKIKANGQSIEFQGDNIQKKHRMQPKFIKESIEKRKANSKDIQKPTNDKFRNWAEAEEEVQNFVKNNPGAKEEMDKFMDRMRGIKNKLKEDKLNELNSLEKEHQIFKEEKLKRLRELGIKEEPNSEIDEQLRKLRDQLNDF